ncbi:prolyl-tRNA synthetase [Patescibacteria group bacterium]|jgi:prolyl-tRNA synthetase|nr:prolyl-tRNA synthetase [Patescibacteria group bacterium]
MKQSHLFTKTRREAPAGETARNAELLIRAGYVHKELAGVYSYLPLGLRVLEKIKQITREEMDALGCQELLMSTVQAKELWESTDRWADETVDVWFKAPLAAGGEVGFGWSHEEPIGAMMRNYLASYRDLPVYVYQFQNKLRNELRAKSGVMRGREFVMKDAYSFCADEAQHEAIYGSMQEAYLQVFDRLGIGADTFVTFATGGAFTQFSHEFQTVCPAGEDVCFINRERGIALNEEVKTPETLAKLGVTEGELEQVRTAEVGNIFNFGRQKAADLDLTFTDESGVDTAVWMGSYGIGITRLMGVLVERFADEKGIVWPTAVAPFTHHVVALGTDEAVLAEAEAIYQKLVQAGVEVLLDDRDARAGEKFADSDLLGIPYRIIVSPKTLAAGRCEVVVRATGDVSHQPREALATLAR